MSRQGSILGGALLVAGTSIGGGMLALPVLTSMAGFLPSLAIYVLCWLFMASTGLLFLEVSQWVSHDSNIISMADKTLGHPGKFFAWGLYLFLFYCLTIAYIVGCGNIVQQMIPFQIPDWMGPLLFVIIFAPLILIPTATAGHLNIFFVAGLGLSYLAFVFLGFSYVKPELLNFADWSKSATVLPIAFTSFAYQGIIPTLNSYMHYDISKTRKAIIIGSFIPLIAYAIWQWLIMGIIPIHGEGGLIETLKQGNNAVYPLKNFIQSPAIYVIGQSFAFFALVTSFLGVALGLRDFLADGLKIKKTLRGKLILAVMILAFPLLIAVLYPHIFLIALDYAGGFGCALLLGLLPVLMVWVGRYILKMGGEEQLPGGRWILVILALFVIFEVTSELLGLFHRLK